MEKLLQQILDKMDEIKHTQDLILSRLNDSVLYPKPELKSASEKKKTKKDREFELKEKMLAVLIHGSRLREKFNLAVTPQTHRILAYLRTGNESAFDGLKRNKT